MKHSYELQKNQHGSVLLMAPNGGVIRTYYKNEFDIKAIRGASIHLVKTMQEKSPAEDIFILTDNTEIQHNCCPNCESSNVDIKSWVSEKDGYISALEEIDIQDAWCNDCEKHIVPDLSTEPFILYNSKN